MQFVDLYLTKFNLLMELDMKLYTSLAEEIEALKPNLKDFWDSINSSTAKKIFKQLLNEPFSSLNMFKLELLLIYMSTHPRVYIYSTEKNLFLDYIENAKIDPGTLTHTYGVYRGASQEFNFSIKISNNLIIGNLTNPNQYLNAYLKGKLRSESTSTAYNKQLNPDRMSLAIFKQWLTTVKPLNSVQAEAFLKTCKKFPTDIREEFLVAIMAHCPKPSIALQKYISEYYWNSNKFPSINRYGIRSMARQTPAFPAVLDERDSEYKPFVANINRTAPNTSDELESTIGTALVLLQQSEYSQLMYNELIKHAQQAPTDLLSTYKNNLKTAHKALTKLIKDL